VTDTPIEIISSPTPPQCSRCGGDGLLSALVPHGWTNTSGRSVRGRMTVVLCSRCDADAPYAALLITWFHVNGVVDGEVAEDFLDLLGMWAGHLELPALDEDALDDDIEGHR
jgi:hypothetical protein